MRTRPFTPRIAAAILAAGCLTPLTPALAQPANDACTSAIALTSGAPVVGTTVGATLSLPATCHEGGVEVWYVFNAPAAGPYQFTLTGERNTELSLTLISACDFPYAVYGCVVGSGAEPLRLAQTAFSPGEPIYMRVGDLGAGQTFTVTAGPLPPPANDECAGALPLSLGNARPADNLAATTSFGLTSAAACQSIAPGFVGVADVFFSFTPDITGFYDLSTCAAEIDTIVSIHSACPASPANLVACNDNGPRTGCGAFDNNSSYLTGISLTAGVTYYIRVAAVVPEGSPFIPQAHFAVLVTPGVQTLPPANDLCTSAQALAPNAFTEGSTVYATGGTSSSCGFNDVWDVWYSFTSAEPQTTIFRFHIVGNSFDNQATLSAYDACGGNELACHAFNPLTNPDMTMLLALQPSQTVFIRVAGVGTSQDAFVLQTQTGPVAAPNASCSTAQPLTLGAPMNVDTTAAASSPASPCSQDDPYGLWYSLQAPSSGFYRIATDNPPTNESTVLAVWDSCSATAPILCRVQGDMFSTDARSAAVSLHMTAGQTVFIRASQSFAGRGQFTLTATGPLVAPPAVPNDTCASAQNFASLPFDVTNANITLAAEDPTDCDPPSPALGGIWYTFTAPANAYFRSTAQTNDIARSAQVMLFWGACGSLTQISCPDFRGGGPVPVSAGTTYHVLLSVSPTREDQFLPAPTQLLYGTTVSAHFEIVFPPVNDHCSSAQRVASTPAMLSVDTTLADADAPAATCFGFGPTLANGAWFALTTQTAGTLTVHGQSSPTAFHSPGGVVFSGSCGAFAQVACDSPVDGFLLTNHFDITVGLAAGQNYFLAVGALGQGGGGETDLTIEYTGTLAGGPACIADYNHSGAVTVQDIFDFLAGYFTNAPAADINHSGSVTVQDIFDFLAAYFTGCP